MNIKLAAAAAFMVLASAGIAPPAWADIDDYEFELVESEIDLDDSAVLSVRLIDKRTGQVVPDAVIFTQRIDMAPEGMEMMTAPIEPRPSAEPGVYSFRAEPSMAGGWRLSLAAKVQGEAGTLEDSLEFKVLP